MIHEQEFRNRAQVVRESARAQLLDIRRARMAKRGPRAGVEHALIEELLPDPVAEEPVEVAPMEETHEVVAQAEDIDDLDRIAQSLAAEPEAPAVPEVPVVSDMEHLAERNMALTDAPALPEPEPEIKVPLGPEANDLGLLPGAGPGLIWMLEQSGIRSLDDLARTEAAELAPKLGLVGQILNLDLWLDFARRHRAPSGQS